MMKAEPLAAASRGLRGRPSPLRTWLWRDTAAQSESAQRPAEITETAPPQCARLLDVHSAAKYLGVSMWTIRDLEAAGALQRVRLPLTGQREVRRLLFDRLDLDRLVDRSK
jgi:hypothetical protein